MLESVDITSSGTGNGASSARLNIFGLTGEATAVVPEPASAGLALLASAAAIARRRRRAGRS